jgi:mxaK protein
MGMRRRSVHLMFGAAVLVCAAFAAVEGLRLREASRANEAVARATRAPDTADLAAMGTLPEAQFAQAVALAKQRKYEEALERYKAVARGPRADLAIDALYNTGNLHFREALSEKTPNAAVRMLPLIELAKQS